MDKGCIITSGNFTDNGLKDNHEYGVFFDNEIMQRELRQQIYSLDCEELSYEEAIDLKTRADEFIKKHPIAKICHGVKVGNVLGFICELWVLM